MQKFYYLIELQFLGFRYHGWQKQPDVKTVQKMVEQTLTYILRHDDFKTLGASRTDAMVSANNYGMELFVDKPVKTDKLLKSLNNNLPADIRALSIKEVSEQFNIIQSPKVKEYVYLFSFGEKYHPFSAPFITHINGDLDIEKMKTAASIFVGEHNFSAFTHKPSKEATLYREVLSCNIEVNNLFTANFFPEMSYLMRVRGQGFSRHQVRLMMGALFDLGRGKLERSDIVEALNAERISRHISEMAPAPGLILNRLEIEA